MAQKAEVNERTRKRTQNYRVLPQWDVALPLGVVSDIVMATMAISYSLRTKVFIVAKFHGITLLT